MLYLVSTPIGNLADLSYRAVTVLKTCTYILCEDTRHSRHLLDHYQIQTPLKPFHKFNESQKEDPVIEDLKEGKTLALISDAGTPLISDPGQELVARCHREEIPVSHLPGPCAVINALVLSGLSTSCFQFIGFLPKKEKERQTLLSQALLYPGTTLAYETPHRIEETLSTLLHLAPERILCIARELTKLHEECLHGTAATLLQKFQAHPPRGEMVLLITPPSREISYAHLSLEELVLMLQSDLHLSKQEAIKMAAQIRGIPKRDVYQLFIPK